MNGKGASIPGNEDPIYVEVYSPVALRKEILSSAIDCIDTLKNYELSRSLRKTKERQEREVKRAVLDLRREYRMLKDSMPHAGIKNNLSIKDPFAQYEKKTEKKQVGAHKEKVERLPAGLARLERELQYIKSKLDTI